MALPVQQLMAAARDQPAPSATAGPAPDPPLKMAAAIQERFAAHREWAACPDPVLASARSLAHQTFPRREQLKLLKDQLRDLKSQIAQALSVQSHKESKHKITTESISNTTAMNERLNNSVLDLRNMVEKRTADISEQLQVLEPLQAKNNEDAALRENIEEAISWYEKFLGFHVVAGEGVKFVFNKIDPQSPEKEYSFCINFDNDRYNLLQCDPCIKDIEELVKYLNLNDDFYKFVRIVREKFQSSAVNGLLPVSPVGPDASTAPFPSVMKTSVKGTSENVPNQSHSLSKSKRQSIPAKRRSMALSAASPGSLRRSPRFEGTG